MNNFAVKSTKCGKSLWSVYEGLAFQSTPPRGRRLEVQLSKLTTKSFQSTPPRGRRRIQTLFCSCFHTISIHASAREATKPKSTGLFTYIISIHASAREATLPPFPFIIFIKISIHASAREATKRNGKSVSWGIFQSTPPRGRRRNSLT